jgi:hypothetical protein
MKKCHDSFLFSYARTTERMLPDPIGNVLEILEINCGLGEKKRAK